MIPRDVHTVGGQVESKPAGLGVQLDDGAIFVLEIGDRAALYNRHAGYDCRIAAAASSPIRPWACVQLLACARFGT